MKAVFDDDVGAVWNAPSNHLGARLQPDSRLGCETPDPGLGCRPLRTALVRARRRLGSRAASAKIAVQPACAAPPMRHPSRSLGTASEKYRRSLREDASSSLQTIRSLLDSRSR